MSLALAVESIHSLSSNSGAGEVRPPAPLLYLLVSYCTVLGNQSLALSDLVSITHHTVLTFDGFRSATPHFSLTVLYSENESGGKELHKELHKEPHKEVHQTMTAFSG